LLGEHNGAVVLMNAETGEILVMASHPYYDPNLLDEQGSTLSSDEDAPLLNRATQGRYPPNAALKPFVEAFLGKSISIGETQLDELYDALGFYTEPQLRMPVAEASPSPVNLRVSPLQMVLAAAALSSNGTMPPARIAVAVNTPQQGWVILPALGSPKQVLPEAQAHEIAQAFAGENPYWSFASGADSTLVTWYLAGTLPDWSGTSLTLVILLEEDNPALAKEIGTGLLKMALKP